MLVAGSILATMTVGACSTAEQTASPNQPSAATASAHEEMPSNTGTAGSGALPSQHVHGVARNPADGFVYLATHDGLFRIREDAPPARVGPVIDLMGFTIAGANHFYASGHPGPGVDLPNPVGLIETADGGQTWRPLSRQGQSDFHTLTASRAGIVGFDGEQLATTGDGRTWQRLTPPVNPHAVAASPNGTTLLATSQSGLARSADRGKTWQAVQTPLLFQLVTWADDATVIGIAPDGQTAVSTDATATWQIRGSVRSAPQALGAHRGKDGTVEILAVTAAALVRSTDNAATFTPHGR